MGDNFLLFFEMMRMSVIELRKITKVYPGGIVANKDVDFDVKDGEIHALLGENGAGKTTLMKIMSGCLKPTSGEIYVNGKRVSFNSPADALKHGIGMVHQHFALIPSMTVLENLKLGLLDRKLSRDQLIVEVNELSKKLGFDLKLDVPVDALSAGERQRLEIIRLLLRKVRVLIFDEPTSLLCGPEIDRFFQALKQLKSEGHGIVFITHKIREALEVSDRITVMREGRVITKLKRSEVTSEEQLVELMIGEKLVPLPDRPRIPSDKPVLIVKDLVVSDDLGVEKVKGVSFNLRAGEILGIAGVEGNGQKELAEAIAGLRPPKSGEVVFVGENSIFRPSYVPADRVELGVAMSLSVMINSVIRSIDENSKGRIKVLDFAKIGEFAQKVVSFLGVKAPSLGAPVKYLSGGNIQKLIVGREILNSIKVLIAEQPTAGLDARSAEMVRSALSELASKGVGIILISSDLDEILKLSDRIAVISGGRIVKIFERAEFDPKAIGMHMLAAGRYVA